MTDHAELPILDCDHLPVGSLTHRIRSLDVEGLATLFDYGLAHWSAASLRRTSPRSRGIKHKPSMPMYRRVRDRHSNADEDQIC
jgi:hypothetical protein